MISKKRLHFIIFISVFFTITTFSALTFFILTIKKIDVNTSSNILNEKKYPKYFIKSINDKINIFENDNKIPSLILEKSTIFLPEYDQKILNQGIVVDNINELRSLIEDFDD